MVGLLSLVGVNSMIAARESYAAPAPNVIKVTARKFYFSPDRIVLKKGMPSTLLFTSNDTTHGVLLRPLNLDLDLALGKVIAVTVAPLKRDLSSYLRPLLRLWRQRHEADYSSRVRYLRKKQY